MLGVTLFFGTTYLFNNKKHIPSETKPPVASGQNPVSKIINVDDLAKNPEKFQGTILLRAVVAGINKSKGIFSIIDCREFEEEGILTCPDAVILPVKFDKAPPKPKSKVNITGRVTRNKKGLIIEAKHVEVIQ